MIISVWERQPEWLSWRRTLILPPRLVFAEWCLGWVASIEERWWVTAHQHSPLVWSCFFFFFVNTQGHIHRLTPCVTGSHRTYLHLEEETISFFFFCLSGLCVQIQMIFVFFCFLKSCFDSVQCEKGSSIWGWCWKNQAPLWKTLLSGS